MICQICGGREQRLKVSVSGIKYVQCTCGVLIADPMPTDTELEAFYNNYLESMGLQEENPHFTEEYRPTYQTEKILTFRDLGFDYENVSGYSWLDVGCANGLFLEWIKQFGCDAVGVDISSQMVEDAKKRGLNCHCCYPDELSKKFDIVSLWDVIEHSREPTDMIKRTQKSVKKGGSLFLQTPCTGIISDTFGSDWRALTYPNHLHLFSQDALFRLLRDSGFMIKSWIRFGSGNTSGTMPADRKRVFDSIAKQLGIGDNIAVWAVQHE